MIDFYITDQQIEVHADFSREEKGEFNQSEQRKRTEDR